MERGLVIPWSSGKTGISVKSESSEVRKTGFNSDQEQDLISMTPFHPLQNEEDVVKIT